MKLKNKAQITTWLEEGNLDEVLGELKSQLKGSKSGSDLLKTATSLSAQLGRLKSDKLKGVITYEQETIALNKLLDKVQVFVETVENQEVEPKTVSQPKTKQAVSKPEIKANSDSSKSSRWWMVAIPLLLFGGWWLFLRDAPIKSTIRICTNNNVDATLNWCDDDKPLLPLSETLLGIAVTATFEGQSDGDPLVTGTLIKALDESVVPLEKIQLTIKNNGVGYSDILTPFSGWFWDKGRYILKLTYNGKPAGEKEFELF